VITSARKQLLHPKLCIRRFTSLAQNSPVGVDGIASGELTLSPVSENVRGETIVKASKYLFEQLAKRAITMAEYDRRMRVKVIDLARSMELFADYIRRCHSGAAYLHDESPDEDEADEDWIDEEDDVSAVDYEDMDEDMDDDAPFSVGSDDHLTPLFDQLFPTNSSTKVVSTAHLEEMWRQTCQDLHADIPAGPKKVFFELLNKALNAYIASILLEPCNLGADFSGVAD